jgi:threonine synthase
MRVQYPDETIQSLRDVQPGPGIDRYRNLFPVSTRVPYLGEGNTPLIKSRCIGPSIGMENLHFKYEGTNPSGAFKDRSSALVGALAMDAGAKGFLTASSGNAAAAMAAYSAAVGMKCLILMEPDNPPAKLRQCLAYGAEVLIVEGVFSHGPKAIGDLILELSEKLNLIVEGVFSHGPKAIGDLILELSEKLNYYPAFVWAPVNPYVLEGIKTLTYEIVAQLGTSPDVIVCPVGGGDMFTAQWRGYQELLQAGLIDRLPRMVGVQSTSASPLLQAFLNNDHKVKTLPSADSKISGINVPFTGEHALQAAIESGGSVAGVSDNIVFQMQKRVGVEEGLWIEPVSAVPVAALTDLLDSGVIRPEEKVVCIMSGAGFKDDKLAKEKAETVAKGEVVPFDVEVILLKAKTL